MAVGLVRIRIGRQIIIGKRKNMRVLPGTKKSLGQHWLDDEYSLQAIADMADVQPGDTVLEVGPGPGTLTSVLIERASQVVAVEFDEDLARELPTRVPASNLTVIQHDILTFDFGSLPAGYKVIANIPYYLTSNLLRVMCEHENHFSKTALLIQKEVAERVCAKPGAMSLLSVSVQFYCDVELGIRVSAALFTPPPKVDSQVLGLTYRTEPLFPGVDTKQFFRIVKAGFSQRRKTLLNSLSAGLSLSREDTSALLDKAGIAPTSRAQALSLDDWHKLYTVYQPV
jgi:16S rRNA (adenine1518-N6/adenine1519-N6)-dimethyltransferase